MVRKVISPRINERGRHESESLVDSIREQGGKRHGRSMKRKPREATRAKVTIDNLKTARDNGGTWNRKLNCVEYRR